MPLRHVGFILTLRKARPRSCGIFWGKGRAPSRKGYMMRATAYAGSTMNLAFVCEFLIRINIWDPGCKLPEVTRENFHKELDRHFRVGVVWHEPFTRRAMLDSEPKRLHFNRLACHG